MNLTNKILVSSTPDPDIIILKFKIPEMFISMDHGHALEGEPLHYISVPR